MAEILIHSSEPAAAPAPLKTLTICSNYSGSLNILELKMG